MWIRRDSSGRNFDHEFAIEVCLGAALAELPGYAAVSDR